MSYLIATVAADGVPHIASTTHHAAADGAWAAVFAFDRAAAEWWRLRSLDYPRETKGPWVDTVVQGSVFRWVLVWVPE